MSYCRWSTDNFRSDVYVYLSPDGYVTHVAHNRKVGIVVGDPPWSLLSSESPISRFLYRVWSFIAELNYKLAIRTDIKLPYSGESFVDDTSIDCAFRLMGLKSFGYNVPRGAIDRLMNEDEDE